LADGIKNAINSRLEELEGFGGVEGVYFTAFVLQ
jgi:flagellar FliL protein